MKKALAILALTCLGSVHAADEGLYAKIGETNCSAWMEKDGTRRFKSWTGGCVDDIADGHGVLVADAGSTDGKWWPMTYEGRLMRGKRSGFGKTRVEGSADYTGQYRNGALNGWAVERAVDGSSYEGQWRNGLRHGVGTATHKNGTVVRGRFVKNQVAGLRHYETADGKSWGIADERPDGTGRAVFNSAGEVEAGTYRIVDGKWQREGRGVFLFENRNVFYVGEFANGMPNGTGTYVHPDKGNPADAAVYGGQFRNGCLWRDQYYYVSMIVSSDSCKRR